MNRVGFLRDIVPTITKVARRITLYASSGDWALRAAQEKNRYPRAGESGEFLVVTNGLETIDASHLDTDMLGHSYFANARPMIEDIAAVLHSGFPPERRNLDARQKDGFVYWHLGRSDGC